MLKKLLGSPPTFIHEHASWSWTSIVPCETAPPGNRVGSIAEIKMLQQNPYLGLVLGECHFSLNDNNGALEWCRKAKALLSDEDPGLQTATDFLKKITSAEMDAQDEDVTWLHRTGLLAP